MRLRTIAVAAVVLGIAVGASVAVLASSNKSEADTCGGKQGTHYTVVVQNDKASPLGTTAKLCDSLTIMNKDTVTREIAFGPHENHVPYDGVAEKLLSKDQSLTVTLNAAGTYRFHDHEHDEVQGYFTVRE